MKQKDKTLKLVLAALFLALAYVLPFLTGQIREIGAMLCPMHIPVLLCGFICGSPFGLAVGFISPLLRSLTLGMPILFPGAACMALELAMYGATTGLLYGIFPKKPPYIYCSLVISMLLGRLIWGIAMLICLGISGVRFTYTAFFAGAFAGSAPGIVIQIILVPIFVMLSKRFSLLKSQN